MNVEITYLDEKKFEAKASGGSFVIDPAVVTPLEYFALGLISCSGVDIVSMAEKNSVVLKSFCLRGEFERNEDFPKKFNTAHYIYDIECSADEVSVKRWVMASIETYCSTMNTIRNCVNMCYTILLNGSKIADRVAIAKVGSEYLTEDIGGCCN